MANINPKQHRPADWTTTLEDRANGLMPGFRGHDETDEDFAAREARGWQPAPDKVTRAAKRPAKKRPAAARNASPRAAGGDASCPTSKKAPAKKAPAKKATSADR